MTLDLEKIESHRLSHPGLREMIREILFFERVESTNRVALDMAADGMPGGLLILSDSQRKGKGRLDRPWFSPAGANLYFSLLLRPYLSPRDFPLFSMAASLALCDSIHRATGLHPEIKWPNDILIEEKKLAGILLESKTAGAETTPLIIGIGVNVNVGPDSFPTDLQKSATSLKAVLGHPIDRTDLLNIILEGLAEQVSLLQDGKKDLLIQRIQKECATLGKKVRVNTLRQEFEGFAEEIDDDGALLLRMGDGRRRRIRIGDITHLREASGRN
ncbi:MAG: biotin--[acetyl-CoA-carboxylase] ligase [Nitrospira sp.]|nr:biotin--[acetyl-CoA-carboxylase] ligase [Candidatus Manganitrophaceae bacterium]HIL35029.1 biotin--[acetyl-CoA-carboxylase] ligase [Candidatus Manganitrophaceae bacterium]